MAEAKKETTTTKKNKFRRSLEMSHKEIKGKRSEMFAVDAEDDSEEYIRELVNKRKVLTRKLMNLEDFHADSTTTLKVTKDGFDSKQWVKEINQTEVALALLNSEITVAERIHAKYFA